MSTGFTQNYKNALFFSLEHYEKFLEICSDVLWKTKAGGWTLAQQYYHGLVATNMLMESISGKAVENPNPEAGLIMEKPDIVPEKAQAALFLANIKLAATAMFENLTDEKLLLKNESVSKKFGRDVTNALVLELIPVHLSYHLGSCDAELRNNNLQGSW